VAGVIDGGHRASGRLGHLPQQRGAWMSELRAARQGRGSVGAPDLRCRAAGARPSEPQPQREPGSRQEAGARRWQRWLGRRRRRYEARARGPGREEEEDVARGGEMAAENKPEERFPKCILRN